MIGGLVSVLVLGGFAETTVPMPGDSAARIATWTSGYELDPSTPAPKDGRSVPVIWWTLVRNYSSTELTEATLRFAATRPDGRELWSSQTVVKDFGNLYFPMAGSLVPYSVSKVIRVKAMMPNTMFTSSYNITTKMSGMKTVINPDYRKPHRLFSLITVMDAKVVKALFTKDKSLLKVAENGITPTLFSCRANGIWTLENLVGLGGNLKGKSKGGMTAAHFAAHSQVPEVWDYLKKKGIALDGKDDLGKTPLHHAAFGNNPFAVKNLLKHKVNVNTKDKFGHRPIVGACDGGWDQCFIALRQAGGSLASDAPDGIGAMQAAARVAPSMLQIVKNHGGDVNNADAPAKLTPLHVAVRNRKSESIVWLLQNGANPNLKSAKGNTIYTIAESAGGVNYRKQVESWVKAYSRR